MADYNLNEKTMYKCVVAQGTGLSEKTITRYFKDYPELEEIYFAIKSHSGTKDQQRFRRSYKKRKSA